MIKKREVTKLQPDLDSFIHGADTLPQNQTPVLDPKAPRKFKTHTIPMNEYEYDLLTSLAEQYGQTHSGIIRFALKQLSSNSKSK